MEIIKYGSFNEHLNKILKRDLEVDAKIIKTVKDIIYNVKEHKDKAVHKYTLRFDKFELNNENSIVRKDYIESCRDKIEKGFLNILLEAKDNIWKYHQNQVQKTWLKEFSDGVRLGQRVSPLDRVGVYVPGGKAFYPSTVLMNIIPAKIAGVKEIVVVTPPAHFMETPLIGATLSIMDIDRIFLVGGAQAIAAMAFGTESIPKVDKIVGPGNIYVSLAKKEVFGYVDIDMIAGPSEVVVLAQDIANPEWIALDLLSQSEHRTGFESSILVTDSKEFAEKVLEKIDALLKGTKHEEIIRNILKRSGAIIVVDNILQGAEVVNKIAPEHLEIIVHEEEKIIEAIRHAGAIFIGKYSTESVGDYWAGPNHVLPTGGTARFFSPLGVYDFCKKSSLIYYTKEAIIRHADKIKDFAFKEDLYFHGMAVKKRYDDEKKG